MKPAQQRPLSMRWREPVKDASHRAFGTYCRFCGIPITLYTYATWQRERPGEYAHWQCFALCEEPVEDMQSIKEPTMTEHESIKLTAIADYFGPSRDAELQEKLPAILAHEEELRNHVCRSILPEHLLALLAAAYQLGDASAREHLALHAILRSDRLAIELELLQRRHEALRQKLDAQAETHAKEKRELEKRILRLVERCGEDKN